MDLARIDTEVARLKHRRTALPELAQIKELMTKRAALMEHYTAAETQVTDLTADQKKAEQDLEPVRARRVRDQKQLDDGSVTDAKALRSLQSEVASLDKRIADLEDAELEVMQALEDARETYEAVKSERIEVESTIRSLMKERDAAFSEIDTDLEQQQRARTTLSSGLPDDLRNLYERIAERNVSGAAEITEGRCTGCRLELDPAEITSIEQAAPDAVIRCDECGRILVR